MERIGTAKRTKEIIGKYDFYFRKKFGQNFLIDPHVLGKIVDSADITEDDLVIEIGPGIGALTQFIAERAGKVVCIEIDRDLIPILKEDTLSEFDNIDIINEDVLKVDLDEVMKEYGKGKKVKVMGNLPYYITTPIVMGLLEKGYDVESITVMVQKEVADRMKSGPGTKDYGALSVAVQYYTEPYLVANVPPNCFMPRPNVDSAVINLKVNKNKNIKVLDEKTFFKTVKAGFTQRRKTLMNSIKNSGLFAMTKEEILEVIVESGFDERIRGEKLNLEDFGRLSDSIYKKINKE
ncbi:MAG: 16S rRNA (adenine(1518)-N(6)/adenine(1519)-N(6))-dimethyltransferase RsmA [Clostridia bacterium]|nr:16S rRNA (adenine(1518)-N(6)/adenine(1519)-N(6))-dimethyltransferase RsmA [Clostridia bacterium]